MLDLGVIDATSAAPIRTELFQCKRYEVGPCHYSADMFICSDWLYCPLNRVLGEFTEGENLVRQLAINGYGLPDKFKIARHIDDRGTLRETREGLHASEVSGTRPLLDALSVGALAVLQGNLDAEYDIGFDRRIYENAPFQERLLSWIEVYGFPAGISAIGSSASAGQECVHPELFYSSALSGTAALLPQDEAIVSIPIIAVIRQLATLEVAARVLLGFESKDKYHVLDKIEVPCRRTLEKRSGVYRLGTEAGCIFDALALQILDMAQYEMSEGLRFCKECGRPFVAQGKAYYCGNPCKKDMASKRRIRAKAKEVKQDGIQEQAP